MKFGVVVFPGSNCDRDMYDALTDDLGQEVIMLWHKDRDLAFQYRRLYHTAGRIFLWRLFTLRRYCPFQPDDAKRDRICECRRKSIWVFAMVSRYFANHTCCREHYFGMATSNSFVKMFLSPDDPETRFTRSRLRMEKEDIMPMKKHWMNWKQRPGDFLLL